MVYIQGEKGGSVFCKVHSAQLLGVEGRMVCVEVDVSDGLPSFEMVGYLAAEVREAQERVWTALRNSGFRLPPKEHHLIWQLQSQF